MAHALRSSVYADTLVVCRDVWLLVDGLCCVVLLVLFLFVHSVDVASIGHMYSSHLHVLIRNRYRYPPSTQVMRLNTSELNSTRHAAMAVVATVVTDPDTGKQVRAGT